MTKAAHLKRLYLGPIIQNDVVSDGNILSPAWSKQTGGFVSELCFKHQGPFGFYKFCGYFGRSLVETDHVRLPR
jgi:hypothetical protein